MAGKGKAPAEGTKRSRGGSGAAVKLEDVARLAGVSIATASRVINNPSTVSPKTRSQVEDAIGKLGWIPHGAAKALASMRTRTVGALIPTLGHQSIAEMLGALQRQLSASGYTLILGRPEVDADAAIDQAAKMVQSGIEGLILMGEDHPPGLFEMLRRRNMFYVIIYTTGSGAHDNCIGFDNRASMAELVRYLLGLGHTSFGVIARDYERNDRIRHRVNAIRETLAEEGLAIRPKHFKVVPDWSIEYGREGMRAILQEDEMPTAVICTNDYLAFGATVEARSQGFRVPDQISVTGFDDIELAAHSEPPLTTVAVPAAETGAAIADFVIRVLEEGDLTLPPPMQTRLVIRGSTAPPSA